VKVDKTAIVSKKADVADSVEIGPYAIVEEGVTIGPGTAIGPHVCIYKGTSVGSDCKIHAGVILGDEPQDTSFKGEESFVEIGNGNTFREYVTVHRGTEEATTTVIGNDNYFMAFSHVAHNCTVGDSVTVCNNTLLAGYVTIEDKAFISAGCLIHQFVRVGTLSMAGGGVKINKDILPFMVSTVNNVIDSYNIVGLKRAELSPEVRKEIKQAYSTIYRSGMNLSNALETIEKTGPCKEVQHILEFARTSKRGICFSRSNRTQQA